MTRTHDIPGIAIRDATAADWPAIAALHTASWRATYRGMRSDEYLDGPVEAERREIWKARFDDPDPRRIVVVAEQEGRLVALACLLAEADPEQGALIDNLHALPGHTGRGLGRRVLAAALDRLGPADRGRPIHLTVLGPNLRARAVYAGWGGRDDGVVEDDPGPNGSRTPVHRIAWPSADALARRLGAPRG